MLLIAALFAVWNGSGFYAEMLRTQRHKETATEKQSSSKSPKRKTVDKEQQASSPVVSANAASTSASGPIVGVEHKSDETLAVAVSD